MSVLSTPDEVIVETVAGRISGGVMRGVHFFKGIPYGDSTAGAYRFLPPRPPKSWKGILNAENFGPRAPQQKDDPYKTLPWRSWIRSHQPMDESCLVLNVYTPAANCGKARPVLFYIHGGGFSNGSGCSPGIDGTNLAERGDMVVVTINHRLNVLGHLYLGDTGAYADSGNNGILDIIAALRWVHENITNFGGDPKNVTISGHSGGGSKVAILMASPLAKGLFHKAIIQSASSLLRMATQEEATRCSNALLSELNLSRKQLDMLRDIPLSDLMTAMRKVSLLTGNFFRPVVDGRTILDHPFSPRSLSINADMPLMIGTCEEEVTFPLGTDPENFTLSESEAHVRIRDFMGSDDPRTSQLITLWRRNHPTASSSDIMFSILSEFKYRRSNIRAAEARATLGVAPVFMYLFTWKTKMEEGRLKSPHTMCLAFCFGNVDVAADLLGTGPDVQALKERVMDAWIAFAKKGDPNHRDIPLWGPYSTRKRSTMIFDDECIVVTDPKSVDRLTLEVLPLFVPVELYPGKGEI